MRSQTTILALALFALIASPALSQSLGSHIKRSSDARSDIHINDPDAAEKAAHFVARCTAEIRSPAAKKILALPYMSKKQQKSVGSKVRGVGECVNRLGYDLRFTSSPLVGGMAEYFVTDVFRDELVNQVAVPTSDSPVISSTPRNGGEIFAQCVVQKDARAVKNLISTEPTSDEEKQALKAVVPLLGQCIPAGEEIALNRRSIRAMLSFGLYRELATLDSAELGMEVSE